MKPTKEIIEEIKKSFDEDIRNKLNPLYDISTSVHKETIKDLRELFEAVGTFAITKSNQEKDKKLRYCKELNLVITRGNNTLRGENINLKKEVENYKEILNKIIDSSRVKENAIVKWFEKEHPLEFKKVLRG